MGKSGDALFDKYEAKLKRARRMALVANVMYGLNWFLGFCALTWASAVILGGLLAYLTRRDYYSVVVLLLLEAVRLSTTTFFGKFVTRILLHGSADPQRLSYDDTPRQILPGIARLFEQVLQSPVFAISILVAFRRLDDLKHLEDRNFFAATGDPSTPADDFDGLKTSLRIFYVLVLINGYIAGLAAIFSTTVVPFSVGSFSLRKYYEKVVWKGMDEGLLHAADFEFWSWTFQMQADEYRSNTRPPVVMKLYGDMMKFLYYHPRHKGFEAAKVALESDDTFEREAAANIVGLWATLAVEVEKSDGMSALASVRLTEEAKESDNNSASSSANAKKVHVLARLLAQTKLLAKLADALDNDECGRAASSSFHTLAQSAPESVLMVRSEGKDEKVADILMDCIHRVLELGKPDDALVYIKAMIPLLSYLIGSHELHRLMKSEEEMMAGNGRHAGIGKYCTPAKLGRLKEDMWTIVSEYASGLKRLQAVAAYVCNLLLSEEEHKDEQKPEELRKHLLEKPEEKGHILKDEQEYLFKVLGVSKMPSEWGDAVQIRLITETLPLPCWARPTTVWLISLGCPLLVVVSSIFIYMYGDF